MVVIDDHELLRTGTRRILDDASGFTVVGEADDGEAALRVIDETEPDVVLVDIRLPSINGIDLARRIVERHPRHHGAHPERLRRRDTTSGPHCRPVWPATC